MNSVARIAASTFALGLASCSTAPNVSVSVQEGGVRCVTLDDHDRTRRDQALLFYSARASLETGARYFRVVARSSADESTSPGRSIGQSDRIPVTGPVTPSSVSLCFLPLSTAGSGLDTYDARAVVASADPRLKAELTATARDTLSRISEE